MIAVFIVWIIAVIWALVDMLKARNEPTWKTLWLLVIILIPILGVILYFRFNAHAFKHVMDMRLKRKGRRTL